MCRSSGHDCDNGCMKAAADAMRAGLVLVHESLLFKGATTTNAPRAECQRVMLMISKHDLSSEMQPRLYEMGRAMSVS